MFASFFCYANTPVSQSLPTPTADTRLAIIMIVDQCAYQFIHKLEPYFTGGLDFLLKQGVVYKQAHHPHGVPATATGFTAFSTGVFARDHGIINNSWFNEQGKELLSDEDDRPEAAVFSKTGLYSYGKSSKQCKVDGLSDQCMLDSQSHKQHNVVALGLKSRSAIALASRLGKAIWFDMESGHFTSSKAYFSALPAWLIAFNKKVGIDKLSLVEWNPLFPSYHPAYQYTDTYNYTYARFKDGFIGHKHRIEKKLTNKEPYDIWMKLPAAHEVLFDLALTCIDEYSPQTSGTLVVWIALNALDLIGHAQGPDSLETTDMLLRLDQQLQAFFTQVQERIPQEQTLYVFSADHGIEPIPELMKSRGIPAGRIDSDALVTALNTELEKKYYLSPAISRFHAYHLYMNESALAHLSTQEKKKLLDDIVVLLKKTEGIKTAWTYDELRHSCSLDTFGSWYQKQLYPGRSGSIIIQPLPYYHFTDKKSGTVHEAPYNQITHVPLIFYQKGKFKPCTVLQQVFTLQVPNTLAYLLKVPRPSSSLCEILPGLYPLQETCVDR